MLIEFDGATEQVHLLIFYPPLLSISELVCKLKGTLPTGTAEPLFINCKEFNDIYTKARVKPGRNQAALNELNDVEKIRDDYIRERTENADKLDRILQALDLTPLPLYATLNQVQKALKTRINADKMIDPTLNAVRAILSQTNPSGTA